MKIPGWGGGGGSNKYVLNPPCLDFFTNSPNKICAVVHTAYLADKVGARLLV